MSRSFKNRSGKGPGYDYGRRRYCKGRDCRPSAYGGDRIKRRTNRAERRKARQLDVKGQ